MDLSASKRVTELCRELTAFMDACVYPAERLFDEQAASDPLKYPPVMEELKAEAKQRQLWNLFHAQHGPGLSNLEYARLAEILGWSLIGPEACNCSAPDTGNMELLSLFGTAEQKRQWLEPLLAGEIRSSFAMTEPDVASSDATNVQLSIERDGDHLVLNGTKWWVTNAGHPHCAILIVMGKTDPDAERHRQQSQVLVPIDTPGVEVLRRLPVLGYWDAESHCEVRFTDVVVPVSNVIGGFGEGFAISQARLGPGRIHHCMRSIGAAERALEMMCQRALSRSTFGEPVASRANIQDWIAEARIEIEMIRLLALKTAWLMDTSGNKQAAVEISAIKIAAPSIAAKIIDRAMQVHGAGGLSDDFPLARHYALQRSLRIADGPDEVHKRALARVELRRHQPAS